MAMLFIYSSKVYYFVVICALSVGVSLQSIAQDALPTDNTQEKTNPAQPPIITAIKNGDLQGVKNLLKTGVNIEEKWNNITPLMAAIAYDKIDIAKYMVNKGANLHVITDKGTPLYAADYANYLNNDPNQVNTVNFLVSELLSPIAKSSKSNKKKVNTIKPPTVTEIRTLIAKAIIKKANAGKNVRVPIQLYDIVVNNVKSGKFIVECDAALVDENAVAMYEVTSSSRKKMPAPKSVGTHLFLVAPLQNDGNGRMAFVLDNQLPRWSFHFSLGSKNDWGVEVQENISDNTAAKKE